MTNGLEFSPRQIVLGLSLFGSGCAAAMAIANVWNAEREQSLPEVVLLKRSLSPVPASRIPADRYVIENKSNSPIIGTPDVLALTDRSPVVLIQLLKEQNPEVPGNGRLLAQVKVDGNIFWTIASNFEPWSATNRDQRISEIRNSVPMGFFTVNKESGAIMILPEVEQPKNNVPPTVLPINPDLVLIKTGKNNSLPSGGLFLEGSELVLNNNIKTVNLEVRGTQALRVGAGGVQYDISLGENPHTGHLEYTFHSKGVFRGTTFLRTTEFITITPANPEAFVTAVLSDSTKLQQDASAREINGALQGLLTGLHQNEQIMLRKSAAANEARPRLEFTNQQPPLIDLPWEVWVVLGVSFLVMAKYGLEKLIRTIDFAMASRGGSSI